MPIVPARVRAQDGLKLVDTYALIDRRPRLRDMPLEPPLETDVPELPIDVNMPDTIRPMIAITDESGQPFAVKTDLAHLVRSQTHVAHCFEGSALRDSARGPEGADPEVGSNRPSNVGDLAALLRLHQDEGEPKRGRQAAAGDEGGSQATASDVDMTRRRLASLTGELTKDPELHQASTKTLMDDAKEVPGQEIERYGKYATSPTAVYPTPTRHASMIRSMSKTSPAYECWRRSSGATSPDPDPHGHCGYNGAGVRRAP